MHASYGFAHCSAWEFGGFSSLPWSTGRQDHTRMVRVCIPWPLTVSSRCLDASHAPPLHPCVSFGREERGAWDVSSSGRHMRSEGRIMFLSRVACIASISSPPVGTFPLRRQGEIGCAPLTHPSIHGSWGWVCTVGGNPHPLLCVVHLDVGVRVGERVGDRVGVGV